MIKNFRDACISAISVLSITLFALNWDYLGALVAAALLPWEGILLKLSNWSMEFFDAVAFWWCERRAGESLDPPIGGSIGRSESTHYVNGEPMPVLTPEEFLTYKNKSR